MNRKAFEVKQISPNGSGLARISTLNVADKDNDVTLPGAFGDQTAALLPAHDWRSVPLGKAHIYEFGDEALADFRLNLELPSARDWHAALKFDLTHGHPIQEYSYGFSVLKSSEGTHQDQRVRFLEALKVHEVSPVVVGAGVNTATLSVKRPTLDQRQVPAQEYLKFQATLHQHRQTTDRSLFTSIQHKLHHLEARRAIERRGDTPCVHLPTPTWLTQKAKHIAAELHVSLPTIHLVRPAKLTEHHDTAMPADCLGVYRRSAGTTTILIKAGQSPRQTLITLAHELHHHHACSHSGRPSPEWSAELYGHAAAASVAARC